MNKVPTSTWNPWNPVLKKKTVPNTESAIVKLASAYSNPCNPVKRIASTTVNTVPKMAACLFLLKIAWWAYVTAAPLETSNNVFIKGTVIGSKPWTETGGQELPNSIVGAKLEWK